MIVKPSESSSGDRDCFVAGDLVGAGIGEKILVITGQFSQECF